MRHALFAEQQQEYPIALLIKSSAFNEKEIRNTYVDPLVKAGIPEEQIIALTVEYNSKGKAPAGLIKDYLAKLMPALKGLGVKTLYCADAAYFKAISGEKKAEPFLGYVLPCKGVDYEDMSVILGVNHKSMLYNPKNEPKMDMSIRTLVSHLMSTYKPPGENIIKNAHYPKTMDEIEGWLNKLMSYDRLSVDIEAASLKFNEAGVATITFCWSEHDGVAFPVDYVPLSVRDPDNGRYGMMVHNPRLKSLLRQFFESYQGTTVWHNSPYDIKVLIYNLWMKNMLDQKGLLQGLHTMTRSFQDTKIIGYLATNSTAGNELSLKDLAQEFAGNWAQEDIKDVLKIPLPNLLEYNLVDGLCTNFVYNKYYPIMQQDNQEQLYYSLMLPSQKVLTQVELEGMPMDIARVADAKQELNAIITHHHDVLQKASAVHKLEKELTQRAWQKDYEDRKAKAKNPDKIFPKDRLTFPKVEFNPGSGPQCQVLLYEIMGLPVIDRTKTKLPATGADTLEKLLNHTKDPEYIAIIDSLIGVAKAAKVLSSFIPAFEDSILKEDGWYWLHGSFNLGGTVSGRLSSSKPNLQNIPSGSTYGKLIKKCFKAPEGWLFCGADFNSLEDYISALTTKDPAKLDVYIKGYDGHGLRAFSYWPDKFPYDEITPELSHAMKKDPALDPIRSKSKNPTFALTYQGTWITLVRNLGFSEDEAKKIEAAYHELYKVSDEWVANKLEEASQRGYVEVAFGLRLRTPLLHRTYRNRSGTPFEAEAEGRTAGNALGQSYGLLNNRACNEFMEKVWASEYRYDIKPVAMIHDAIYLVIKDDPEVVAWVNRELIKSMQWQELPEIQHDTVKIGAELDIFYPTWADAMTIPNGASVDQIAVLATDHINKMKEAA